jgi:hypothetical protein
MSANQNTAQGELFPEQNDGGEGWRDVAGSPGYQVNEHGDVRDIQEWRFVQDYPEYQVSDFGRVRSCWKHGVGGRGTKWNILKPKKAGEDYLLISLHHAGDGHIGSRAAYVHHLVLETFVGPCPPGLECRHLNGNKSDNSRGNLIWGTKKENQADRVRHGTSNWGRPKPTMQGSKHFRSHLTEEDVIEIRRLSSIGVKQEDIARQFGITQACVSAIVRRITWKHI